MLQSQTKNFTLIVDEFQEFEEINKSVFNDIQNIWDSYKDKSKINVVFLWFNLFNDEKNI
jgi:hypothetical protein